MKFSAFIFLSMIAILVFQPAFSAFITRSGHKMMCGGKSPNAKMHCEKNSEKTDDCNNCNPFMVCMKGCYYLNTSVFIQNDLLPDLKKRIIAANENVTSSYLSEFWHPPRIFCS
jgi:sulfatase maturation enzyme AslB (radical SAM superfamily)